MGLKSSHWCCLKACFKGYTFCFTIFLVRPSTGAQQSHKRAPKKRSNDLGRSKFRQQVQSFVCVPPWRCDLQILGNALKCLRGNPSTSSTKKYFFPKNFELCAQFCGVQSKPGWRYIKRADQFLADASVLQKSLQMKVAMLGIRSRRLWSSFHGLGWIGAISQVTLN